MISHSHKTLFLHIPKCAGTSIEYIFLKDLNINYNSRLPLILGKNKFSDAGPPRLAHLSLDEMIRYHYISNEIFESYTKFTIVRDPVRRAFSIYKYLNFNNICSFENFTIKILSKSIKEKDHFYYFFRPQTEFLKVNGNIKIDYIFKLEDLDSVLPILNNLLKSPISQIEKMNKTAEQTLRQKLILFLKMIKYYPRSFAFFKDQTVSSRSKDVIKKIYHEDYKLLGYD